MKVLVHLHLYYQHMLDQMLVYLKNIEGYNYDLYVTIVDENEAVKNKILNFKKDAEIIIVENRGFDVAPFLTVLNQVDLDAYDYVVKLHTKRDMSALVFVHGCLLVGKKCWREKLLEFVSTKDNWEKAISLFNDPQVGMVSNNMLIIDQKGDVNKNRALFLLKSMGLELVDAHFVAGTMFICRSNLLKAIKTLQHKTSDFELHDGSLQLLDGTLAHVYERLFGFIVWAQNKAIVPLHQETSMIKVYKFINFSIYRIIKRLIRYGCMVVRIFMTSAGCRKKTGQE